mmetsp:Transcript_16743/g.36169  ORF Transcript_16743/g.36169 Transcript_16743/m.36169 type:complete len:456 (+) Transcript_16743:71-1438(+)
MLKPLIPLAFLSACCHAFQIATPSLRTAAIPFVPSSRVLIPTHASLNNIIFQKMPPLSALHQSMMEHDLDDAIESPAAERVEHDMTSNKKNDAIANFRSKLKQILNIQPSSFFLSLSIFLLPFTLLSSFPDSAWAVQSGGRMGGSFSGGSSRQSSSRSYSAPSSRQSRGYSRGYSSGGYSRPNVIVSPRMSPYYSRPLYSPFYARPSGVVVSNSPSFTGLFLCAGFFLFALLDLSKIGSNVSDTFSSTLGSKKSVLGPGVSVAEISVALEVPDRDSPNSILSALDRLSRTARTDSRVGLQNLTSQVAIELLRRKLSIVAASTRAYHYRDENKAQREYNNISIQERGKFQRETVSKYGGVDYSDARIRSTPSEYLGKATVAVVTIVMLIDGDSTSKQLSSKVNSIRDVEDALSQIAADAKADNCLRGAEILWSPEERDETLTMKEVLADYSSLRSV